MEILKKNLDKVYTLKYKIIDFIYLEDNRYYIEEGYRSNRRGFQIYLLRRF